MTTTRRLGATTLAAATLTALLSPGSAAATAPGSNGVIVFDYRGATDPGNQILSVDPATHAITNLSRKNYGDDQPAVAPNGKKIAFRHGGDIWTMLLNGTSRKDLTPGNTNAGSPTWSPDGRRIAFIVNNDLVVMSSTGTNIKTIVTVSDNFTPTWSPDGTRIAFTSYRSGMAQIWTASPSGYGLVNVSRNNRFDENDPDWSPDGAYIAFNTNRSRDGARENFQSTPDGATKTEISYYPPSGTSSPAYSPDGTALAFTENIEGSIQIAVEPRNGVAGQGTYITNLPGTSIENLSWAPLPTG